MSWTVNDFRRDLKELKRRYKECDNNIDKEILIDQMMTLAYRIGVYEFDRHRDYSIETGEDGNINIKIEAEDITEKKLVDYFVNSTKFQMYYPYLYRFRREYIELEKIEDIFYNTKDVKLSKKDVIELVHEFFKHTTKEIYNEYLKFDNGMINFMKNQSVDKGTTYYSPGVKKPYIEVGIDGDKRRLLRTLVHERGHVIGHEINNYRLDDQDFFVEIESLFFELIATDYYAKELDDRTFNNYNLQDLMMFYDSTNETLKCKEAATKTFNHMNRNNNPFKLFKEYSNGEDLNDIDMSYNIRYSFSYLVALELREIYEKDKELAFDLLKKIVKSDDDKTEYDRIVDNITPCKSLSKIKRKVYNKNIDNILSIKYKNTDN